MPRHSPIGGYRATVDRFLGKATSPAAGCTVHHVDSAQLAPPVTVVRAIQRYGWHLFAVTALLLMLVAAIATVVLVTRWPKAGGTPPKGILPPLRRLGP